MGSVFITDMNVMVADSAMTGATNGIVVCIITIITSDDQTLGFL